MFGLALEVGYEQILHRQQGDMVFELITASGGVFKDKRGICIYHLKIVAL